MTLTYPNVPLHELMQRVARRSPDRVALRFKDRTMTFGEFDEQSNRLANGLARLGLSAGDRIGIFVPNCFEFQVCFYAASKLGAVACPLNSAYKEREVVYQLNDAGASLLLTHLSLWPIVEAARSKLPLLRSIVVIGGAPGGGRRVAPPPRNDGVASATIAFEELCDREHADPPSVTVSPEWLLCLPYSSGTTGLPKGVMLTHRNLVANHIQFGSAGALDSTDVLLVYVPMAHIYGVALMGIAMWSGAQQILMERFDLPTVVDLIERHGVTWLHVVPPVLLALASSPDIDPARFRSLKFILNAAAPLVPDVARRVERRLGVNVIQAYGLTEASPDTHHSPLQPDKIRLESVGVPVADTEHMVVDSETGDGPLPAGAVGEIVVRGPQVMQGYWNAPECTASALRDGWLYTGDIGWIDSDGYTFIVDRKKEMIKYKSFSIAPAELEAIVMQHPEVADCAVVGAADAEVGEVPKAFVVARAGGALDIETLSRFVAERVAGYKQVRRWEVVSSIPRTPSGKILRRMLKETTVDPDAKRNA
jgi:long-chain acyl-CoA synthetase